MQGIIVQNISNLYQVMSSKSWEKYEATARGKLKKEKIMPVVGDYVEFCITDPENKKAVIDQVLNRKVYIKRPKLANISQILFVVSSKEPKPDLLLLDRQLAFVAYLGIRAIIVLNKSDLDDKQQFCEIKRIYEKARLPSSYNQCKK